MAIADMEGAVDAEISGKKRTLPFIFPLQAGDFFFDVSGE
jgi:hypothetical protein